MSAALQSPLDALPDDVRRWIRGVFQACNDRVSAQLTRIPTTHETTLDHSFIATMAEFAAPVRFPSQWVVRIATHYLGGMRHFDPWEIADIGLLVILRRAGKVVLTKVALLQSKRLYPVEEEYSEDDPSFYEIGFGRLLSKNEPVSQVFMSRAFSFDQRSRYKALRVEDDQYKAIRDYETQLKIPVQYLLYHPLVIPWTTTLPVTEVNDNPALVIGCRVIPATDVRRALKDHPPMYTPLLGDLEFLLPPPFTKQENAMGWPLEAFVSELLLTCRQGYVAEDPLHDDGLFRIFNRRSGPIAAAIAITFDAPG